MQHPELVLYDVAEGVATLTFNRPDRMNGMTGDMEVAYFQRLQQAAADDEVKAIIVTGAGRGWCVGADLAHRPGEGEQPLPNTLIPTTTPLSIPKPIVAAVNGACAGMGLALAMMCDFRIAAAGVKFSTAFARRGLIAEYGLAWHLSQIAGRAVALDLLLTARVALAEEMQALGLVNRVVPADAVLDEATALARDLAANVSPASMATIKRQVLAQPTQTAEDAMHESDALMYESLKGADVGEGIKSFLEKRPAEFAPFGSGTRFGWMDS
jgi:enoyl-CoA hydratase/carnithine racemase